MNNDIALLSGLLRGHDHIKAPRRMRSAELIEHLRTSARQHQVCYEIRPLWTTLEGARTQKDFELLLCGVNGHVIQEGGKMHAVPCCEHCASTYGELREIAEWVLLLKKPPRDYRIYAFDCAFHLAPPNRQCRAEIVITTAVFLGPQPQDCHSESACLREVRERLARLGIGEDDWSTSAVE